MFLTCHNYWIVCRLVKDDKHPYLVYSPQISIEDSSEPFRAFLGAVLSVIKGVSVERSENRPDTELDILLEERDDGPLPENDIDDGSGEYEDVDAESKLIARPFLVIHALSLVAYLLTGYCVFPQLP
jgi:hypothetical protein